MYATCRLGPGPDESGYFLNLIFFTRIGIPSIRNQWFLPPKLHLFETVLQVKNMRFQKFPTLLGASERLGKIDLKGIPWGGTHEGEPMTLRYWGSALTNWAREEADLHFQAKPSVSLSFYNKTSLLGYLSSGDTIIQVTHCSPCSPKSKFV